MDDPNLTMEEYIRLEEEKAHKRGKVFNWQTATYGKIRVDDDLHNLSSVEAEFPAIVINDAVAPQDELQCKSQVSTPVNDEIDFRISFDESDDEDYTIFFDKNSFSYKMISFQRLIAITTRGGKATTLDVRDNDTSVPPKEPVVVELEKPAGSNEDLTNDQPQITSKPVVQPSNEVQPPPVPFPKRLRKEKDEAQQRVAWIILKATPHKFAFHRSISSNAELPSKEKDPGSFTIPCDIGQLHIDNALADLGASISLMPYTMYKKLGLGEPKATRMSLELADRGLEKSIDLLDLECYESASSNENDGSDSENSIRRIDSANTPYPVMQGTTKRDDVKSEHLYSASANEIDEKKPELKNLPQHLEYAYLHGDKSFPIIISSELSEKEKISLLQVLEKRKGAIAWKMSDIKGISPSYCTHKILMEDDYK
ncbi:reverse transcriptase domain-containing protein [Tanacetum coccineum]